MNEKQETQLPEVFFKDLPNKEFLTFGMNDLAYVRPVVIDSKKAYAIHAADGTPLSIMESEESALETIRHNEMDAASIH